MSMFAFLTLERFDRPAYLWLALMVVVFWWLSRKSLSGLGPIRGKLCLLARAVVVVFLVLAMAGMHKIKKNDDLNVLFVLDQSHSVPGEVRREAEDFILKSCQSMRPNDRASILTFDGQTNIEQLPSRPGMDGGVHVPTPFGDGNQPDRTNISQSLRMASACTLDSTNNRFVILSDGNENIGDATEEAKAAAANEITIDVLPLHYRRGNEVVFEQLRSPNYANIHEQVPLRLVLNSDMATSGTILIYQRVGSDEELVDLAPGSDAFGQRVELRRGRNAFSLNVPIEASKNHKWRGEFVPDDVRADALTENNVAQTFTNVEGPQTILFIGASGSSDEDRLLIDALVQEDIEVYYQPVESMDMQTSVLQDYAAIVLANVGADLFSANQQRALATYVRDLGGGLIMVGGDDSFGAGGWQGSVVEDIMPIKFDVDAVKQIPKGALAIVMHSCEMPQGNKWGIETAVAALKTVSRLDYFGVVSAGGMNGHHWEVPMQPAANKDAIIARIRNMQNADMFSFEQPMQMAYKSLMNCRDAQQRHMIIISDGDPSSPSGGLLNWMVGSKVTCSTVSVFPHGGMEISTMRRIAKQTGGTYYPLGKPGDEKKLPQIFIKEAKIVRRPLIRDEVFKPVIRPNLSAIMKGIGDDLPKLKGYVVTTPRKVADVEMPLVTKRGDPLLAHWLCGFGRTVAFTSGEWKRWGSDWPQWPGYSKLWAQAVRWSMRQGSAADWDVRTIIEGEEGHLIIESAGDDQGFANARQFAGSLICPDGATKNVSVVQTGPGRYEARFKATEKGTYLVDVREIGGTGGEKPAHISTGLSIAYSPEFKDLVINESLLREVADETDGRVLTLESEPETVFAHNLDPTITRTPIWDLLLELAVLAFLLDVACRRIAIDPMKMLATARQHISTLAGRFGAGRRAEETLTGLKRVRAETRTEKTASGDVGSLAEARRGGQDGAADEDAEATDATLKFDAGEQLKKPAGDLTEALGGHKGGDIPAAKPVTPKSKGKDGPPESVTARLLKAKKRAREQQDESKNE